MKMENTKYGSKIFYFDFFLFVNRLKGSKKDDQYRLLWAELKHLLEIGPQSPNHKKLLLFIKNENISDTQTKDADKLTKRLSVQVSNSPMSPPGSSDVSKKKVQYSLSSSGNRYV